MKPHPKFGDRSIPSRFALGDLRLKALSVDDLERDYEAVMQSAAEIKAAHPGSSWPDRLTKAENLIDLAWHQREFSSRRSFAWVIEDLAGLYLGCLYVYPSIAGDDAAEVKWWWRAGADAPRRAFREDLRQWLASGDWPPLDYKLQDD